MHDVASIFVSSRLFFPILPREHHYWHSRPQRKRRSQVADLNDESPALLLNQLLLLLAYHHCTKLHRRNRELRSKKKK